MKKSIIFLVTTVVFWSLATPFLWKSEERGDIVSLALVSHSHDRLKSEAIAEWLDLSAEKSTPLNSFNLRQGEEKLLKSGVIEKVQLYKLKPSALVVSYTLRTPYASIANWKNLGIDSRGFAFPLSPFFSPKELPEIVFIEDPQLRFAPMKEVQFNQFLLAKKILMMEGLFFPWTVAKIDLSRLKEDHPYGGELVLTVKNGERRLFIRLWLDGFEKSLTEFASLLSTIDEGIGVDLRLSSRILVF